MVPQAPSCPSQAPRPPAAVGGGDGAGAGGRRRPSFARLPAGRLVVEELRAAVNLANRIAKERGVSIENLLSEREKAVVEQVVAPASLVGLHSGGGGGSGGGGSVGGGGSAGGIGGGLGGLEPTTAPLSPTTVPSRPSTANSTSRPSTATSRPSSSTTQSLSAAVGNTTLSALTHSKSRLSSVRAMLERDRELLLADVAFITAMIDDHLAAPEPPSLSEVRAVSGKLREVVEGVERMDVMIKVESKAEPGTPSRKPPTARKIPTLPVPPPTLNPPITTGGMRPNSAQRLRQEVKSVREGKILNT